MGQVIFTLYNSILARVKNEVDTETICEHYLGLVFKARGRRKWALCPIHGEKTESLCLFPDGKIKCFGCGFSGDVLDLISKVTGKLLKAVIDMIALDYGIKAEKLNTDIRREMRRKIEQDKKVKQQAKQFRQSIDACFNRLVALLRDTYKIRLQSESDLDKIAIAAIFDTQAVLEWLLDDLMNDDIECQFEALQRARRCGLWG